MTGQCENGGGFRLLAHLPDARTVVTGDNAQPLAFRVESDGTVDFISEILSFHGDYQIQERGPRPEEIGRSARELKGSLVVQVQRGDRRIGGWEDSGLVIERGDRLLVIDSDDVLTTLA